jgi:hypothetical protein
MATLYKVKLIFSFILGWWKKLPKKMDCFNGLIHITET